jgi:2-oxoglutarate dehydrogenase E1 component
MLVINCSTAANYFHLLRTHMRMPFRKPLVVIAPKKMLKLRSASSPIEAFGPEVKFQSLIADQNPNLVAPEKVKKVVFCTGQVYYDLSGAIKKENKNDIAVVRVESICPFPFKDIAKTLQQFKNASVTWAQEEPKNAGVYLYAQPRLRNIMTHVGRQD